MVEMHCLFFALMTVLLVECHAQTVLPTVDVTLTEGTLDNTLVHQVDAAYRNHILQFTCSRPFDTVFNSHFRTVGKGQEVYTSGVVDREAMVTSLSEPNIPVSIVCNYLILKDSFFYTYSLLIDVTDINDFYPTFSVSSFSTSKLENENVFGASIDLFLPTVEDLDEGVNGSLTFSLTHENYPGLFNLELHSVHGAERVLRIISTMPVDREVWPYYTAQVNAFDGGNPSLSNSLMINVTFLDRNDNLPVFSHSRYNVTIDEGTGGGVELLTVSATDADVGTNAELTYRISGLDYYFLSQQGTSPRPYPIHSSEWLFTINSMGVISTRLTLDREAYGQQAVGFFIEVSAVNGALVGQTFINVTMNDINDNPPRVTYVPVYEEVPEDFSFPLRIGTIQVNDPDAGSNGSYSVVLQNSQVSSFFYLGTGQRSVSNSGKTDISLYLNSSVDYESNYKQYTLNVMATDLGSPPQSSSVDITISIEDVNDSGPVFTSSSYAATIQETNTSVFVTAVEVTDEDGPEHNVNRLHLPESTKEFPHQHLFRIAPDTSDIYTSQSIDREALESGVLVLLVEAVSLEDPPKYSASATVTVTITDVNDNTPTFDPDTPRSASVKEESSSGTLVSRVRAHDADISAGSPLTFSIMDPSVPFLIDTHGNITTAMILDRERDPNPFVFNIRVFDGRWAAFLNFTVTLEDINDNRPSFYRLSYAKSLSEDAEIGTTVSDLSVTDDDQVTRWSYTFVNGNEDGKFSILESGSVILVGHLDREVQSDYTLRIVVSDGKFTSSNTATVTVTVLDTNDNPPVFSQPTYYFTVPENNGTYAILGFVNATSSDQNTNRDVRYSVSRPDLFSVQSNGRIQTLTSLDREQFPVITFSVIAEDGTSIRLTNSADVVVTVLDEDDEGPSFGGAQPTVVLPENYPLNRVFYTASPTDPDEPQHSVHTFSITSMANAYFTIDSTTGGIQLTTSLDYESVQQTSLTIRAEDSLNRFDEITLTVNVSNVDDNAPQFPNSFPHQLSVDENRQRNTLLYHFEAFDLDGSETITASISDRTGAPLSQFHVSRVSTNTFELYTSATLDREATAIHIVRITLVDASGLSSYLDVEVRVNDINDNLPVFESKVYTLSVLENEIAGTTVGSVSASDSDEGENASVQYELLTPSVLFAVDASSGVITTLQPLDRETDNTHSIVVMARDLGRVNAQTSSTTVTIQVQDVNDNLPVFDALQVFSVKVREDSPPGTQVVPVYVTDDDSGTNAQVTLSLLEPYGDESLFGFHGNNLIVTGSLDYETHTSYILHVKAEDMGGLSATKVFNITVVDINDENPQFNPSSQSVTIREDAESGSRVAAFRASDGDGGDGGRVKYRLGMGNFNDTFQISTSGVVTLARRLDFEEKSSFSVEVIAEDMGSPGLLGVATLSVSVVNVNDNPPLFGISSVNVLVSETTSVGDRVITVTATDADTTTGSSDVIYSILGSLPKEGYFEVGTSSGVISLTRALDYEDVQEFTLIVRAVDSGGLQSLLTVVVFVDNVNDNPPQFNPPLADTITIQEDTAPGTILTTVSAIDPDNATYTAVSLSLHGEGSEHFEINLQTYYLSLVSSVDAEDTTAINLTVRAEDNGNPPLVREEFILVRIGDVNDHSPVFRKSSYAFEVKENLAVGSSVGVVVAIDDDVSSNRITYSLSALSEVYSIVPGTGDIQTKVVFDYEDLSTEERCTQLQVTATDSSFSPRSSSVSVTVCVTDGNDHEPVFDAIVYYVSVNSLVDSGTSIAQVTAADADEGSNQQITYSLAGSNLFSIDSDSGSIAVAGTLNHETEPTHEVNITARDGGFPSLSSSVRVVLSVITSSDRPPSFPQTDYTFTVAENTPTNQFTRTVRATDPDSGTNGAVSYSLAEVVPSSIFAISSTGVISLTSVPDYEAASQYSFQVVASDGSGRQTTAYVTLHVTDLNDNSPEFSDHPTSIQLSGVEGSGYTVYTLRARDDDSSSNGEITYSLLGGSPFLSVDSISGDVTSRQQLSADQTFSVTFVATDKGNAPLSSQLSVSFTVIDSSVAPSFGLSSPYTVHVPESSVVGGVVHTFSATSQLVTDPPRVYSLSHTSFPDNLFSLNVTTGELTLKGELDFETSPQYTFVAGARQEVEQQWLSDYLNVTLQVTDVNDNSPVFQPLSQNLSFLEDRPKGDVLFKVSATDRDSGSNRVVQYSIKEQSYVPALRVDPTTGEVYVNSGLDAERSELFQLVVMATDRGIPPRSSTLLINITVIDVNDNQPRFVEDEAVTIQEDSPLNTIVYLSHADDRDPSTNLVYSITRIRAYQGTSSYITEESIFTIDSSTGTIRLSSSLNREDVGRYVLTVSVTDGEYSHSMLVTVKVGDSNDNTPTFDVTMTTVNMDELSPAGSKVIHLTAEDEDLAENALITYSLEGDLVGGVFAVNNRTGLLTLASPLRAFSITGGSNTIVGSIVATDRGSPARSSSVSMTINIVDVNNHPPVFLADYSNSSANRIFSNLPSGSEVLRVSATDADVGSNAAIVYRISPTDIAIQRMFTVTPSGVVEVSGTLFPGVHTFTVQAWNSNPVPYRPRYILHSSATVAVEINRMNEHPPLFTLQSLTGAVLENTSVSEVAIAVYASDMDFGVNGEVVYSARPENIPFAVSTESGKGVVRVSGPLDRETRSTYEITIIATDRGFPARSGSAIVTVTVTDINDNRPRVSSPSGMLSVRENSPLGTLVAALLYKDGDEGPNGEVEYSLLQSSSAPIPFTISRDSGRITTTALIDREMNASFSLTVSVTDKGNPPLSSSRIYTVQVKDVDEFEPTFAFPSYSFTVRSTSTPGDRIGSVKAEDGDATANLVYSFADGEVTGYFLINSTSGDIFLIAERREETPTTSSSFRRRRQEQQEMFRTIRGVVEVSDTASSSVLKQSVEVEFSVSTAFAPVVSTVTPTTEPMLDLWVIIIIVVSGAFLLAAFVFAMCVGACLCYRRRSRRYKISKESPRLGHSATYNPTHDDWDHDGKYLSASVNGSQMLDTGKSLSCGNSSRNISEPETTPTKQSRRSYEIEMTEYGYQESPHKYPSRHSSHSGAPVFPGTVASLRSTSDLGSTVGTEYLDGGILDTSFNHTHIPISAILPPPTAHDVMLQSGHLFDVEGGGESAAVDYEKGWLESGDEDSVKGFNTSTYDLKSRSSGMLLMESDANQWRRSKDSDLFRSQTMDMAVDDVTSGTDEPVWHPAPYHPRRAQSSQGHHAHGHGHHRNNPPYYRQRTVDPRMAGSSLSMYQGSDGYYQPPQQISYQSSMHGAKSYQGLHLPRKASSVISEPYYDGRAYQHGRHSVQSNHSQYYNTRQPPVYTSRYEHTVPYHSQHTDSLSQPSVSPADDFSMRPTYAPEPTSHSASLSSISIASTHISGDEEGLPDSTTPSVNPQYHHLVKDTLQ